ncbi:hypothetical protein ES703_71657 [subsurface metagenome]
MQNFAGGSQSAHRLYHMDGNANGSCVVGNRTGNCLPNPPGGIGAEFISPAVLVFVHSSHQAGIAFLD